MNNCKEEITNEKIAQLMADLKKEIIVREVPEPKNKYDFSKANLKSLSKKQLIRIIYHLKERLDVYEN